MKPTKPKYYIYHIPGKKIGVTTDLGKRVTEAQGYKENEFQIMDQSEDINYISTREHELQTKYGYKVDTRLYKDLFKKSEGMVSSSEQTSTFPCSKADLDSWLEDNKGVQWTTPHGEFSITDTTIPWLVANARTSQFSNMKCYIYNKALVESMKTMPTERVVAKCQCYTPSPSPFDLIRTWASERGIYESGDSKTQVIKLYEEVGELSRAILKKDDFEIKDAIGDAVVVLTNLAVLCDVPIEDCIEQAYNVIAKRQGKMVNGTFVKTESL
jgi:NTP pyrophosphatase (non-canonical NTP hydrolase)